MLRFEESDYSVSEGHGELEVCVLADRLSVPVQVLVKAVNLTAKGQFIYKMVALSYNFVDHPQLEMISPLQLQHWNLKKPVFANV